MNFNGIKAYLANHPEYFKDDNNRATSWHDYERWPDTVVDRNHLIMPGEFYMVDAANARQPGSYWIVRLGRSGQQQLVRMLSDDMRRDYGFVVNGYWLIPKDQEIKSTDKGGMPKERINQ